MSHHCSCCRIWLWGAFYDVLYVAMGSDMKMTPMESTAVLCRKNQTIIKFVTFCFQVRNSMT
jgi:hypothetical protein